MPSPYSSRLFSKEEEEALRVGYRRRQAGMEPYEFGPSWRDAPREFFSEEQRHGYLAAELEKAGIRHTDAERMAGLKTWAEINDYYEELLGNPPAMYDQPYSRKAEVFGDILKGFHDASKHLGGQALITGQELIPNNFGFGEFDAERWAREAREKRWDKIDKGEMSRWDSIFAELAIGREQWEKTDMPSRNVPIIGSIGGKDIEVPLPFSKIPDITVPYVGTVSPSSIGDRSLGRMDIGVKGFFEDIVLDIFNLIPFGAATKAVRPALSATRTTVKTAQQAAVERLVSYRPIAHQAHPQELPPIPQGDIPGIATPADPAVQALTPDVEASILRVRQAVDEGVAEWAKSPEQPAIEGIPRREIPEDFRAGVEVDPQLEAMGMRMERRVPLEETPVGDIKLEMALEAEAMALETIGQEMRKRGVQLTPDIRGEIDRAQEALKRLRPETAGPPGSFRRENVLLFDAIARRHGGRSIAEVQDVVGDVPGLDVDRFMADWDAMGQPEAGVAAARDADQIMADTERLLFGEPSPTTRPAAPEAGISSFLEPDVAPLARDVIESKDIGGLTHYERELQRRKAEGTLQEGIIDIYAVEPQRRGTGFFDGLTATRRTHKFGAAVDVKDFSFYKDPTTRLYLAPDSSAGAALTPDGDLVSVYKAPGSTQDIDPILAQASKDAVTLDAYDISGVLPNLYSRHGFRPAARVKFDSQYAPDDWPYDIAGEPDVVLMVRDPEGVSGLIDIPLQEVGGYASIKEEVPLFTSFDEALAARNTALGRLDTAAPEAGISPFLEPGVVTARKPKVFSLDKPGVDIDDILARGELVPGDRVVYTSWTGKKVRLELQPDGTFAKPEYTGPTPGVLNELRRDPEKIARGKTALLDRIRLEVGKGGLDPDVAETAVLFINALPDHLVADIGSSFVGDIGTSMRRGEGYVTAGVYDRETSIITIAKGIVERSADPDRIIIHEIAHHLEQFIPSSEARKLVRQWERELKSKGKSVIAKANRARGRQKKRPLTEEERLAVMAAYRYEGGFAEWLAEVIADKALRDIFMEIPAKASIFRRILEVIQEMAAATYNAIFRRGHRDHAERVYQKLIKGEFTDSKFPLGIRPEVVATTRPRELPFREQLPEQPPEKVSIPETFMPEVDLRGTQSSIDAANEMRKLDSNGYIGTVIEETPVLKQVRRIIQRKDKYPAAVMNARIAQDGARAEIRGWAAISRMKTIKALDSVFTPVDPNKAGTRGHAVDVQWKGPRNKWTNIVGTILDIAQRPRFYALTDIQKEMLSKWADRNNQVLRQLQEGYNLQTSEYTPSHWEDGGVFLSNIDSNGDMITQMDVTLGQAIRIGRDKERWYDTASDRILSDPDFKPVVDIVKLQEGMDSAKAIGSARELFKDGSGGLTRVQVVDKLNPGLRKRKAYLANKVSRLKARLQRSDMGGKANRKVIDSNFAAITKARKTTAPLLKSVAELDAKNRDFGTEFSSLSQQMRDLETSINHAAERGALLVKRAVTDSDKKISLIDEYTEAVQELSSVRAAYNKAGTKSVTTGEEYKLVENGVWRYYPVKGEHIKEVVKRPLGRRREVPEVYEVHKGVTDLTQQPTNAFRIADILNFVEGLKNTVLGGDLSPILGVHLPLFALFNSNLAVHRLYGAGKSSVQARDTFHAFRQDTMHKAIEENLQDYMDIAFYSGTDISGITVEEFAGGFMRKLPWKFGSAYVRSNEAMFAVVMRQMQGLKAELELKWGGIPGVSREHLTAAAVDQVTKILPLWHPGRRGLSPRRAQVLRTMPTSISFLIRPAENISIASGALAKKIAGQELTLKERMALDSVLSYFTTVTKVSIATAGVAAIIKGRDIHSEVIKVVDPTSPLYGSMTVPLPESMGGDRHIPLGGAYLAPIKAIAPGRIEGLGPVPIPFAGVPRFLRNRIGPAWRTIINEIRNKDFYGEKIRDEDAHFAKQILQGLVYAVEGSSPISVGSVIGGLRRGLQPGDIVEDTGWQFGGSSGWKDSPYQRRTIGVERWVKEQGINYDGKVPDSYGALWASHKAAYDEAYPEQSMRIKEETKRQARQGVPWAENVQALEDADARRIASEEALVRALYDTATPRGINEAQFRQRYSQIMRGMFRDIATLDREYQMFDDDEKNPSRELPRNKFDRAKVQYFEAFEQATLDGEILNFDILEDILYNLKNNVWDDDQAEYIEKDIRKKRVHPPKVQEFLDDRERIEELGYWGVEREILESFGLTQAYRDYKRSSDQTEFKKNTPNLGMALTLIVEARLDKRTPNPFGTEQERRDALELETLLWKWGYIDGNIQNSMLEAKIDVLRARHGGVITDRTVITAPLPAPAMVR
jgi:hypothetical protein